jgi:ATP-dependent 26S proteasome regulatory subunit
VVATTNRVELLDSAVRRPGRFDLSLHVPLPPHDARTALLRHYLARLTLAPSIDVDAVANRIADVSDGVSGAVLADVAREAGMCALRRSLSSGVDSGADESVVALVTLDDIDAACASTLPAAAAPAASFSSSTSMLSTNLQ